MATTLSHQVHTGNLIAIIGSGRALLERFPTSVLAVAFRLAVAAVFFRSGLTKIASWDATVALFEMEYTVPILPPALAACLATATELGASALVAFGLSTRFAAAALFGMTLVIQLFVYPESWPDHLLWGSILAYLVTRGPGALSIDHLIAGRLFEDQRS